MMKIYKESLNSSSKKKQNNIRYTLILSSNKSTDNYQISFSKTTLITILFVAGFALILTLSGFVLAIWGFKMRVDNIKWRKQAVELTKQVEKQSVLEKEVVELQEIVKKLLAISSSMDSLKSDSTYDKEVLKNEKIMDNDTFEVIIEDIQSEKEIKSIPTLKPVRGYITRDFTGESHPGIDIAVPPGTEVKASADGIVRVAEDVGDLGLLVEIEHKLGFVTRYGHNSKLLVKKGDRVFQGDVIALSGNTGVSTGPHLHFEILKDGKPVNPNNYISE